MRKLRLFWIKAAALTLFVIFFVTACLETKSKGPEAFVIANSKKYGASLFRQDCAICHGPEGHGKTLDDGTKVPSLREGEFKMTTETLIHKQITEGGNGMPPFRGQLTEHELQVMTDFVYKDLRGN